MGKDKDEAGPSKGVELSILLKFINKFDGSRDRLAPFLNNCQNAIDLASPSQQIILFKYIVSQLEGRAEIACSIKEFETFDQLEDFLKNQFGEKKHYAALLSELQDCRQLSNEAVNQFGLRVESCLAKLITEINITIPTKLKGELTGRIAAMQDLALHAFVTGLNPRLATVIRCRNPSTLNEAISFASSEEKILQATLKKHPTSHSGANSYQNRPQQSSNFQNQNRYQHPNNYQNPSQRSGQFQRPQNRGFQNRAGINITNESNDNGQNNSSSRPVCRYCKNEGHLIKDCRKREFNNKRFGNYQNQGQFSHPVHHVDLPSFDQENEGVDEIDNLNE